LTPQSPTATGLNPTYATATASDTVRFANGRMFAICKNTSGSSNTVTVVVPGDRYGQANPDISVVMANNTERWIGPFDAGMKGTDGTITIQNSAPAANVLVAIVAL
jgi:hypothetical protein